METPDKNKTDGSLGDLKDEVAAGFTRIETDIRELRGEMVGLRGETTEQLLSLRSEIKGEISGLKGEMKAGFERVDQRIDATNEKMYAEFARLDDRLDKLNGRLLSAAFVIIATLVGLHFA